MKNDKTNFYAIVGFGISFIFSIVGLVFSVIGLKKAKVLGNGKGFAIGGIIVSIITFIFKLLLVIGLVLLVRYSVSLIDSTDLKNICTNTKVYGCKYNREDNNYLCKYDFFDTITIDVTCPNIEIFE